MARRVRGGVTATTIWLIVFVFLFVISTAMAIVFFNERAKQTDAFDQAVADLRVYARENDRADNDVVVARRAAAESDRSVVRQLLTQIEALERTIGVSNAGEISAAYKELSLAEGALLINELRNARSEITAARAQVQQLQAAVKERDGSLAAFGQKYDAMAADRTEKVQALTARLKKLEGDLTAYQQQVEGHQKQIEDALSKARNDAEKEIRGRDTQIKSLQDELAKANQRIKAVTALLKRETPEVPDQTLLADGRIISYVPEEKQAYIDLGKNDHLVLGMTFEVFDAVRGVKVDAAGELRGKATLEIVDIAGNSSVARVIRSSGPTPALAGDLIANVVYDKGRVFKFYIFGDFDLDNDGQYTVSDRDAVVRSIQQWGGVVVDVSERNSRLASTLGADVADKNLLPLDTDFVVIGQEPDLPQAVAPGERDPSKIRKAVVDKQKWDEYVRLRNEALALSVPVINHNRFLALIGHVNR
jgi:peptidoglycan hydrolase CwlO-like protein